MLPPAHIMKRSEPMNGLCPEYSVACADEFVIISRSMPHPSNEQMIMNFRVRFASV